MIEAFKKLFNLNKTAGQPKYPSVNSNTNFITEPDKITSLLNKLSATQVPCNIFIDNNTEKFISEIQAVTANKNTFTLDELTPSNGNALLQQCRSVKFVFFYNGIDVSFSLKSPKIILASSTHTVEIPDRVYCPKKSIGYNNIDVQALKIHFEGFSSATKLLVIGHAAELSEQGISATLIRNKSTFERGDLLKKCHIILPDTHEVITFDLIIDLFNHPNASNAKTFISGHFENMSQKDEATYEHFIRKIDQQNLKKRKSN